MDSYPWPNESTTLAYSNTITSNGVLFSDVDGNTIQNAVFFSGYTDPETNLLSHFVLRLVRSGSFLEVKRISVRNKPTPGIKMLLIDVDLENGVKELMYISGFGEQQKLVVLDIVGDMSDENRERVFDLDRKPVEEASKNSSGFSLKRSGASELIEIGDNIIFINPGRDFRIESSSKTIHGGWGLFSNLMTWKDGLKCSRECGDCYVMCSRLCNDPVPLNGGDQCSADGAIVKWEGGDDSDIDDAKCESSGHVSAESVESVLMTKKFLKSNGTIGTFRLRACEENDCDKYEILNNGNCDPDPDNPRPGGPLDPWGISQPYDPDNPPGSEDDDENNQCLGARGRCPSGKACDPKSGECLEYKSFSNIYLESTETVRNGDAEPETTVHKYRISLSHDKALPDRVGGKRGVANWFCILKGYDDGAINFTEGTETPSTEIERRVYVVCLDNGLNHRSNRECPPETRRMDRNGYAVFGFRDEGEILTHPAGDKIHYLKSVRCKKNGQD